ncbi:MAG: hypothetical protein M3503_04830 [Actinomycetota bacterium]|nr:hypothetical protein [Actinomycetota bacterium]
MSDLVDVRLVGLPIAAHRATTEHIDELLREFVHLDGDSGDVPRRLLQLRDDLQARFSSFTAGPHAELVAAAARGDDTIDLAYRVPEEAGAASAQALALLDEADELCLRGDHLLTLATPSEAVRYRRWFFGEFERQCRGEPPTPWQGAPGA